MMRHSLSRRAALAACAVACTLVAASGSPAATHAGPGNPFVKVVGKPTLYGTGQHKVALVRINNTSGKVVALTYWFTHYGRGKQIDQVIEEFDVLVPPGVSLIRDGGRDPTADEARAMMRNVRPTTKRRTSLDLHVQGTPTMDDKCAFSGNFTNTGSATVVHANVYFVAMRGEKIVSFGTSGVDEVKSGAAAPASTLPATCAKKTDVIRAFVELSFPM